MKKQKRLKIVFVVIILLVASLIVTGIVGSSAIGEHKIDTGYVYMRE